MKAVLFLEDGKSFYGEAGQDVECLGEVIINTAVVGYQEMITDPEYKIGRPRQLFNGSVTRSLPAISQR